MAYCDSSLYELLHKISHCMKQNFVSNIELRNINITQIKKICLSTYLFRKPKTSFENITFRFKEFEY